MDGKRAQDRNQKHRMGSQRLRRNYRYPFPNVHIFIFPSLHSRIVESNKVKFRLEEGEVEKRRGFVTETKRKIQDIKDDLTSAKTKGKMEKDSREVNTFTLLNLLVTASDGSKTA
jgi:hypothetical protein